MRAERALWGNQNWNFSAPASARGKAFTAHCHRDARPSFLSEEHAHDDDPSHRIDPRLSV
jgi:hypothetical protein